MRHSWTARTAVGAVLNVVAAVAQGALADDPMRAFDLQIKPLLQTHCYSCHGPEKQKADLNLAIFKNLSEAQAKPEVWKHVLERVQADEMPPSGSKPIPYGARQDFLAWLRALPKPKVNCQELATDRTQNFYRGYVMSRRLNRHEYGNSIRDLFGLDLRAEELLPKEGGGGEGFDNTGDTLFTSSLDIEKYLEAAERITQVVLPGRRGAFPRELLIARGNLIVARPGPELAPREAARQVLNRFVRRAFRRPAAPAEVEKFLTLFDHAWQRGDGYEGALRLPIKAVLVSPHFLFLPEPEPEQFGIQPLPPHPLASRLSYFIWASMPDEELLALADSGQLHDPAIYRAQIKRMLADPKAAALGERFAPQWLELEGLGVETRPDAKKFPEFDEALAAAMRGEVARFFNHLLRENRSLLELIDADYTFVNHRLAALYGLPAPAGSEFQQVKLPDRRRGGVMGMAAVHAATSYPLRTSPVLRGKWVIEALLGDRVPPPPPNVPSLEVDGDKGTALSVREQLKAHRANPECASCHNRMDPLGFGMENFDVLGRWRDESGGQPIDASGVLPSGQKFSGAVELKAVLLAQKQKVLRHLTRKMTGYAFGRELNKFDDCVINDALKALERENYRAAVLIEEIAVSFPFRNRFYAKATP